MISQYLYKIFGIMVRQYFIKFKPTVCRSLQNYLMKTDHPLVPICCVSENKSNKWFDTAIAA